MATTLEEEMSQLNQLLEAIEKDKTFVPTKISRSASIELSTKSPRASHHDLEDYMERWYSLLEAADSYEPLVEAGCMIVQVFQDDNERWYGELLRLCRDVVAAMHINECRGIPERFDPSTCNCEALDIAVSEALKRADDYLQNAGPEHPLNLESREAQQSPTSGPEIVRSRSNLSIASLVKSDSGLSVSSEVFSMKSLRKSIRRYPPNISSAVQRLRKSSKAGRSRRRESKRESRKNSDIDSWNFETRTDADHAQNRGDWRKEFRRRHSADRSEDSSGRSESDNDHERSVTREVGRGRHVSRDHELLPPTLPSTEAQPHPSGLLEVPDGQLLDWLSSSQTSSKKGFQKSSLFDTESGQPNTPSTTRRTAQSNGVMALGGGMILLLVGLVIFVLMGARVGGHKGKHDEQPLNSSSALASRPTLTAPVQTCVNCRYDTAEPGCFFNVSSASSKNSPGQASAVKGACTKCRGCNAGFERRNCGMIASGNCIACPAGKFKTSIDNTPCVACTKGTFQKEAGRTVCKSCQARLEEFPCFPGQSLTNCGGSNPGICQ